MQWKMDLLQRRSQFNTEQSQKDHWGVRKVRTCFLKVFKTFDDWALSSSMLIPDIQWTTSDGSFYSVPWTHLSHVGLHLDQFHLLSIFSWMIGFKRQVGGCAIGWNQTAVHLFSSQGTPDSASMNGIIEWHWRQHACLCVAEPKYQIFQTVCPFAILITVEKKKM